MTALVVSLSQFTDVYRPTSFHTASYCPGADCSFRVSYCQSVSITASQLASLSVS